MSTTAAKLHTHTHRDSSLFARHPVITGIVVGVVTLVPHAFLSPQASLGYAAIVIALIAGIYFGFAVMNGSERDQFVEFNITGLFAVAGLLGLLLWPILLPLAYFAHALWDFAHHNRLRLPLVNIPAWYVPWCVIIDVIVGVGLLVIWRGHGLI
jgi:4-amino-4-deoxy-L-arabinose transferase-like glycosyltransferase